MVCKLTFMIFLLIFLINIRAFLERVHKTGDNCWSQKKAYSLVCMRPSALCDPPFSGWFCPAPCLPEEYPSGSGPQLPSALGLCQAKAVIKRSWPLWRIARTTVCQNGDCGFSPHKRASISKLRSRSLCWVLLFSSGFFWRLMFRLWTSLV